MGNPSIPCKYLLVFIFLNVWYVVKQYKDDPSRLGPGLYNPK